MKNQLSLHVLLITTVALSSITYGGGLFSIPGPDQNDCNLSRQTSHASTEYYDCDLAPSETITAPDEDLSNDAPGSQEELHALISQENPSSLETAQDTQISASQQPASIDAAPTLASPEVPLDEQEDATGGSDKAESDLLNESVAAITPALQSTPIFHSEELPPAPPKKRTPPPGFEGTPHLGDLPPAIPQTHTSPSGVNDRSPSMAATPLATSFSSSGSTPQAPYIPRPIGEGRPGKKSVTPPPSLSPATSQTNLGSSAELLSRTPPLQLRRVSSSASGQTPPKDPISYSGVASGKQTPPRIRTSSTASVTPPPINLSAIMPDSIGSFQPRAQRLTPPRLRVSSTTPQLAFNLGFDLLSKPLNLPLSPLFTPDATQPSFAASFEPSASPQQPTASSAAQPVAASASLIEQPAAASSSPPANPLIPAIIDSTLPSHWVSLYHNQQQTYLQWQAAHNINWANLSEVEQRTLLFALGILHSSQQNQFLHPQRARVLTTPEGSSKTTPTLPRNWHLLSGRQLAEFFKRKLNWSTMKGGDKRAFLFSVGMFGALIDRHI